MSVKNIINNNDAYSLNYIYFGFPYMPFSPGVSDSLV